MKACPFCEAELRDSVIRCTRCGRSLRQEPEPVAATPALVPAAPAVPRPPAPIRPDPWTTPATRAGGPWPSSYRDRQESLAARRALPTTGRRRRVDVGLLGASLAAVVAGGVALQAVRQPWVHLRVSDTTDLADPVLVAELTVRGRAALVGTVSAALAVALVAFGLIWFFYSLDRGWTIPGVLNPALAILASIAGLVATTTAGLVWFAWEDAMVARARAAGLTQSAMREILDAQPAPLVEIERLSGLLRFGGTMAVGLLAAGWAWWAYRKRD